MIVKPDWSIFKAKFSDNPQKNFEWFCYLLFCREFNKSKGIPSYFNQAGIETEPIEFENNIIGWQAKFYDTPISKHKTELEECITTVKHRYPKINTLFLYTNQKLSRTNKGEESACERAINDLCSSNSIKIEWRTESFFESEFVSKDCYEIASHFFIQNTMFYYETIALIRKRKISVPENNAYKLNLSSTTFSSSSKHPFEVFLRNQIKLNTLYNTTSVFLKGIAGVGKTAEMIFTFNSIVDELSTKENYYKHLLYHPIPVFIDLPNCNLITLDYDKNQDFLLFLDGLDEISESQRMMLIKNLSNLKNQYKNIVFIISGRDASFINEMKELGNHIELKLSPYTSYDDRELFSLANRYKNTPLESLVAIPFYRNFAQTDKAKSLKTYKDFMNALVTDKLIQDKARDNKKSNVSSRMDNNADRYLTLIKDSLSNFCHYLFINQKQIFSENELKSFFNDDDLIFVLTSSLFNYLDENNIGFISNIFFEYFLALYYSKHNYSDIKHDLFIPSGKVKIRYLNVITILLNLMEYNSQISRKLSYKLNKENPAYMVLCDYEMLPDSVRYKQYKKILSAYNKQKKEVYYGRFTNSFDILSNIDSLADKVTELLPEKYATDAVIKHVTTIKEFLDNPVLENLTSFTNAIILLTAGNKVIWNIEQQNLIKEITIPLIKFFLNNSLAINLKGLLSADTILRLYFEYEWTNNWIEDDWKNFIHELYEKTDDNFFYFSTKLDYELKSSLFNYFYQNKFIWNLYIPLVKKILSSAQKSGDVSYVPDKLDDEFQIPVIHIDYKIYYLANITKNSEISVKEILSIYEFLSNKLNHAVSLSYENRELTEALKDQFKKLLPIMNMNDSNALFSIFTNYIDSDNGMHLSEFNEYITLMSDSVKVELYKRLVKDLENGKYQKEWFLYNTIALLLNVQNGNEAELLLKLLNKEVTYNFYKKCIACIYNSYKTHVLSQKVEVLYSELFPEDLQKQVSLQERKKEFQKKKVIMLSKEVNLITSKDMLIEEINKILEYIDKPSVFYEETGDSERLKLINLETQNIQDRIEYDFDNKYSQIPVFSEFAVKILDIASFNDEYKVNRKSFIANIEEWYSQKKYFWRFFFWNYVSHYKKEEVISFLEKNPNLKEIIISSMKIEVLEFINEQDYTSFDGGNNRKWIVPFVFYISHIFNNHIPGWIEKNYMINFIAYPAWALSFGFSVFPSDKINWQDWTSVFEWLKSVTSLEDKILLGNAIEMYPKLITDYSKTQLITYFISRLDSNTEFREKMLEIIVNESLIEANKDYLDTQSLSIMNTNTLPVFWRDFKEDVTERLKDKLPFNKYSLDEKNYCRKAMLEYFCRVASDEKKKQVQETISIKDEDIRTILCAKLGDETSIIALIEKYINGQVLEQKVFYACSPFGKQNPSKKLLIKYIELFEYSLQKSNDRRPDLQMLSLNAIKRAAKKENYKLIKRYFSRMRTKRRNNNQYFEELENALNEIEQKVYE